MGKISSSAADPTAHLHSDQQHFLLLVVDVVVVDRPIASTSPHVFVLSLDSHGLRLVRSDESLGRLFFFDP